MEHPSTPKEICIARVAVVGAGIAGLSAAFYTQERGHTVVLFESGDQVGGRCTSVSLGGFLFDTGATSIAPRGRQLEAFLLGEPFRELIAKVTLPIYTHSSLRVAAGDSSRGLVTRYACYGGNAKLGERIASGLNVRLNQRITSTPGKNGRWIVADEEFDYVILAVPSPVATAILEQAGSYRPIQSVSYRSCLSVLLGYATPTPQTAYHALIEPEQRHPLTWLSIESAKVSDRAPEGKSAFVAQMSPEYSRTHFDSPSEAIIATTCHYLERLYGPEFEVPEVGSVVRWQYSQPEQTAMFESVNRSGATLIIAGDGVMGPRVEWAFESGYRAAQMVPDLPA